MLRFGQGLDFLLQLSVSDGDYEGEVYGGSTSIRVRFRVQCSVRIGQW